MSARCELLSNKKKRNGILRPNHYDVKFRGIPFTTMEKSFQALKFRFDLPIPKI